MNSSLLAIHTQDLKETLAALKDKISYLEDSQKKAATILSYIDDALLLIDFQGSILECNQAAATLFGLEMQNVLAHSFWDYFDDHFFGFSMKELLKNKKEKKRLILSIMQEQQKKQVEVTTAFVPETGLILILRDRSEIERLEKCMQENNQLKALGEMAATLAHEIRNPLGGIKGFASLLLYDYAHAEEQKKMIQAILEGTERLNNLVTHVLDYAKPCSLNFTSHSVGEIINRQLLYLSPKDRDRIVIVSPEEWTIIADDLHFGRALLNVIQNALEASPPKKKIVIKAEEGTLSIQDQGPGIPSNHMDKITIPFFTTKSTGTGLGLAEVHKILKYHGFTYKIDSSDKGTTVTIFCGESKA